MIAEVQRIGIAGAGVMGMGIAVTSALAGYTTIIYDPYATSLDKAKQYIEGYGKKSVEKGKLTQDGYEAYIKVIQYTDTLSNLVADILIEAIPEQLNLKQELFHSLDAVNAPNAIFATNTSSIPVTAIAAGVNNPGRVIGMHFFNPAPLMKLVEVIEGERTDSNVTQTVLTICKNMGKVAVLVKDTPGFVVNRVARHYYLEGLRSVEEQAVSFSNCDALLENIGFKMGPFKLMDLIGVNTNHEVTKSLFAAYFGECRFRPSLLQQKKVEAGLWGQKSGKGFYSYND